MSVERKKIQVQNDIVLFINKYVLGTDYVPECIGSKKSVVGKMGTVYQFNNPIYILYHVDLDLDLDYVRNSTLLKYLKEKEFHMLPIEKFVFFPRE